MSHIGKDVFDDALALSTSERVALVERLLESLDAPNEEINAMWSEESDRRVEAYEKKLAISKPVSEVLKKYK